MTIFVIIALVLLGIFIGVLAARFVPMSKDIVTPSPIPTLTNTLTPTIIPTEAVPATPSGGLGCQYKGNTYEDGESFPDECNSCSCESGEIACTTMACL